MVRIISPPLPTSDRKELLEVTLQGTQRKESADPISTPVCVYLSIGALGICWFVSGILFALYCWDVGALFLFYMWSVPFFAAGWIVAGIPIIALGSKILRAPKLLLGLSGALAGIFVIFLCYVIFFILTGNRPNPRVNINGLARLLATFAASGAAPVLVYRFLLQRFPKEVSSERTSTVPTQR